MSAALASPAPTEASSSAPAPTEAPAAATPPGSLLDAQTPPADVAPETPATPAEPPKPIEYAFEPPQIDGKPAEIDTAALDAFKAEATKLGLTQEQFQALGALGFERMSATVKAQLEAPQQLWNQTQREWQDQIKADSDIGGAKLDESLGFAAQALDRFGGPELRQALNFTGAGNNPEVVKAFVKIGRAIADPSGVSFGKPTSGKSKSGEQAARDLYNAAGGTYPDLAG